MAQVLNASNTSAVFIATQANVGTPISVTGLDVVQVVGTPKFTPRGPGIIRRADVYTPFGGEIAAKTGGIGWDISITTELYWDFGNAFNVNNYPTPLAALFRACPFDVTQGLGSNDTVFKVQALYRLASNRSGAGNSINTNPFTIVYQETGGKQYSAYDCVCIPKFSWEAGGKVMIEWSIKGKWVPVADSANTAPNYDYTYMPVVGTNCSLSLSGFFGSSASALSKVTFDPGYALSDVLDAKEEYGMGVAMIALTSSPSLELEVADLTETLEPDWTDAEANTLGASALQVGITVASGQSIKFALTTPQLVQWPTPGDSNGYRNIGLKFAGIVNTPSESTIGYVLFDSTP